MNDRKRTATKMRRELVFAIIMFGTIGVLTGTIWIVVLTSNPTKEQSAPLPKPVYTNNHGQSLVIVKLPLEKWMKAHPNAKIISIARSRFGGYSVIYEEESNGEAKDEADD